MIDSLRKWIHSFSPTHCIKHELIWKQNRLRCPVCNRLLAYWYNLKGENHLVATLSLRKNENAMALLFQSLPEEFYKPAPKEHAEIDWEREPIEPLLSDTWDDDPNWEPKNTEN